MNQQVNFSGRCSAYFMILTFLYVPAAFGQVEHPVSVPETSHSQETDERLPHSQFIWEAASLPSRQKVLDEDSETTVTVSEQAPVPFTGLAIGWKADSGPSAPGDFQLQIRSRPTGDNWGDWTPARGYLAPEDSPSGLFWATLYVTPDGKAHDEYEARIQLPENRALTYLKVSAADARYDGKFKGKKFLDKKNTDMPDIIPRENWWGSLPPGQLEPNYTPNQIDITHALVHHSVTHNEPPDPQQVVRQIWDWHVNDNGWSDIGYNFLLDHHGNIYQGRYNPWIETTDVQGAHASRANSSSVGLVMLGQFEPDAQPQFNDPTAATLDALAKVISWRFSQKNINPFDEGFLAINPAGSAQLPVISGHRDVAGTSCPGENLYNMLYQVREKAETGSVEDDDDEEEIAELPFELGQNFPNPFQSQTTIPFTLEEQSDVRIDLYNVRGQKLRGIYSEAGMEAGNHKIPFNASGLSSGAYYYEFATQEHSQMKLMVYIR